jgi:hypothetical protein
MEKPKILEVKTLHKFSVKKQFVVEVFVDVYAESQYEAEKIADEKLRPIEHNDSVSFDFSDECLDSYGDCVLMSNMEVGSVWENDNSTTYSDTTNESITLFQCEEDEGCEDVDTLFCSEDDAIDYWNDNHKTEDDE